MSFEKQEAKKSVTSVGKYILAASHKKVITEFMLTLGYQEVTIKLTMDSIKRHLLSNAKAAKFSTEDIETSERFIVATIAKNIKKLTKKEIKMVQEIAETMQMKAGKHSCESAVKLLLYTTQSEKLKSLHNAKSILVDKIQSFSPTTTKSNIDKIFGYILSLNFDKCSYMWIYGQSLLDGMDKIEERVVRHAKTYNEFINIDINGQVDPHASLKRREILKLCDLLMGHLQRDPEEAAKYDAQMLSARDDKQRLLQDVRQDPTTRLIDIGPAGGATFKDVVAIGGKLTKYFGIEFDANELKTLNELLSTYKDSGCTATQRLAVARFVEGNALELANVIRELKVQFPPESKEKISIVLSSVIHEIYSYCPYPCWEPHKVDNLMTPTSSRATYNVNTVEKIYREALIAIKDNPAGGSINVRDGVMYENPQELVTATLQNDSWVKMFEVFLRDEKYKQLGGLLSHKEMKIGQEFTLPAKYVQEFMIKANWGADSFGNEINEIYCYMTLQDHIKMINEIAMELNMSIQVEASQYIQQGYREHITQDKIIIKNGFGNEKFPPTNMVIKVATNPILQEKDRNTAEQEKDLSQLHIANTKKYKQQMVNFISEANSSIQSFKSRSSSM